MISISSIISTLQLVESRNRKFIKLVIGRRREDVRGVGKKGKCKEGRKKGKV